jgi:hypothetical protein
MAKDRKRHESPRQARHGGQDTPCEERREALLDEALEESFPASDPPSIARPPDAPC